MYVRTVHLDKIVEDFSLQSCCFFNNVRWLVLEHIIGKVYLG
jgi:hypothetical protein